MVLKKSVGYLLLKAFVEPNPLFFLCIFFLFASIFRTRSKRQFVGNYNGGYGGSGYGGGYGGGQQPYYQQPYYQQPYYQQPYYGGGGGQQQPYYGGGGGGGRNRNTNKDQACASLHIYSFFYHFGANLCVFLIL